MSKEKSGISAFQKYLTVWVILCMVIGVGIGKFLPQIPAFLNRFEYARVSIPMARINCLLPSWTVSLPFPVAIPPTKSSPNGCNCRRMFSASRKAAAAEATVARENADGNLCT